MCNKKSFKSLASGNKRAEEINNKNKIIGFQTHTLRPYVCFKCNGVHLTSWPKKIFSNMINTRNKVVKLREKKFIRIESDYYEKLYNFN